MTNEEIDALWRKSCEPERFTAEMVRDFANRVAAAEREACAKVCEAHVGIWIIPAGPGDCAAAIRARGSNE